MHRGCISKCMNSSIFLNERHACFRAFPSDAEDLDEVVVSSSVIVIVVVVVAIENGTGGGSSRSSSLSACENRLSAAVFLDRQGG